jgi:hypothetical protein
MLEKNYFLSLLEIFRILVLVPVRNAPKRTLHFHDFVHISKTYPLQSLKKKNFLKMVAGTKYVGFRYLFKSKSFVFDP